MGAKARGVATANRGKSRHSLKLPEKHKGLNLVNLHRTAYPILRNRAHKKAELLPCRQPALQ